MGRQFQVTLMSPIPLPAIAQLDFTVTHTPWSSGWKTVSYRGTGQLSTFADPSRTI